MKVLVLTRAAWDDSNSTGNTMTNIFSGFSSDELANVYCREAPPNNKVCKLYYSISEKDLIKGLFSRKYNVGKKFYYDGLKNKSNFEKISREEHVYSFFRKKRNVIAFWVQDLLWRVGRWKNQDFDQFLLDYKPDVVFAGSFYTRHTHRLLWYIQEKTGAKVILFHFTDYMSVNWISSPLEKINRILLSNTIKKSAKKADLNYCISEKQQEEYSRKIGKKMKILYKGADFSSNNPKYSLNEESDLIQIVYLGSIFNGRWKTLGILANAIKKINNENFGLKFNLKIYSQYKPSKEAEESMTVEGASQFMGKIPTNEVPNVLKTSDIVLHVESFERKEKLSTRLSFSTKIVDLLKSGRCIMAIGWEKAASIDYLLKNNAAIVATEKGKIIEELYRVVKSPFIINEYSQKAWNCGKRNHQIHDIQNGLKKDIRNLVKVKR